MKIKRTSAMIISLVLTLTMLAGCGNNDSSQKVIDHTPSDFYTEESEESAPTVVAEPDFLGFLTGKSETDFYNMSFEELTKATGGQFTEENAVEYSGQKNVSAKYYLGEMDSILGGRLKLPRTCEVYCVLRFTKDKLKYMALEIKGVSKDDAMTICDDFITAIEGTLPDGYERFPDSERASDYEVGFTRTWDDFIVSMTRRMKNSDSYDMTFTLENYAERYGLND